MGDSDRSRRDVMRAGGVAMGATALTTLSGCLATIEDAVPFLGGAPYENWLPEPGTVGTGDHYWFTYTDLQHLADKEDEFDDETIDGIEADLEQTWSPIDVDWDDATWFALFRRNYLLAADHDVDEVGDDLEDANYEDETDHEGYTVYLGPHGRRAVAVDGSHVVIARGDDPVDNAEDIVDTANGEEDRYVEESQNMRTLVDALDDGTIVSGRTREEPSDGDPERGQFEEMVARGERLRVKGADSTARYVVVYEDGSDVDTDDLEEWVEANDGSGERFENLEDVSYRSDGRQGIIQGTVDTDEL